MAGTTNHVRMVEKRRDMVLIAAAIVQIDSMENDAKTT